MNGQNGVQMQVHPKFLDLIHDIQRQRINLKLDSKAGENALSTKRLSLTIYKLFMSRPDILDILVNAEIDKREK